MSLTKIVKIDPENPKENLIKEAADILRNGGLVVIPTDTVYGIAAAMSNDLTLQRLHEVKKRPKDKPFSLHIALKEDAERYAIDILPAAYRLMDNFWPGPLTLILKSRDNGKIGIRMPNHKVALSIIAKADLPVVCPSANISGNLPPKGAQEALKELDGLVDLVVDAGVTPLGKESTVVDAAKIPVQVIREGAIPRLEIERVANKKTVLFICTGNSCRSVMAAALLKKLLKEKNRDDVEVLSAGIMMMAGLGATGSTLEVLKMAGIDASGHRSQAVTPDMIKKSDFILVMERIHEQRILQLSPEAKNRLFLLKEFAKISDNNLDIADPIGKPMEFYENTFNVIKELVEKISEII